MAHSGELEISDAACCELNPTKDVQAVPAESSVDTLEPSSTTELKEANSADLSCLKCNCLILRKGVGSICKIEVSLYYMYFSVPCIKCISVC